MYWKHEKLCINVCYSIHLLEDDILLLMVHDNMSNLLIPKVSLMHPPRQFYHGTFQIYIWNLVNMILWIFGIQQIVPYVHPYEWLAHSVLWKSTYKHIKVQHGSTVTIDGILNYFRYKPITGARGIGGGLMHVPMLSQKSFTTWHHVYAFYTNICDILVLVGSKINLKIDPQMADFNYVIHFGVRKLVF